jgi:hypothetical protein
MRLEVRGWVLQNCGGDSKGVRECEFGDGVYGIFTFITDVKLNS